MADLRGRRIIVTGASAGIGFACSEILATRGAHVIMACRDTAKAKRKIETSSMPKENVSIAPLDLCDRKSIELFAKSVADGEHGEVQVLINNAGVLETKHSVKDGIEKTLLTNHIGPSYLTQLLISTVFEHQKQQDVRIVNVGSRLEKNGNLDYSEGFLQLIKNGVQDDGKLFDGWTQYSNSKQMNLLWTNALQRRHKSFIFHTVTPGMVNTDLSRSYSSWFLMLTLPLRSLLLRSPTQGAESIVHCAVGACDGGGGFRGDKGVVLKHSYENRPDLEDSAFCRTLELIEYWQRRISL